MNTTLGREPLSPFPPQWEAALDEARDLDKYKANWDGEGADAVPLALLRATIDWLAHLQLLDFPPPACIYPLADGTVMIEWHYAHGAVESANMRGGGRIEVVRREPGSRPTFTALTLADFPCEENGRAKAPGGVTPEISDGFEFALAA